MNWVRHKETRNGEREEGGRKGGRGEGREGGREGGREERPRDGRMQSWR